MVSTPLKRTHIFLLLVSIGLLVDPLAAIAQTNSRSQLMRQARARAQQMAYERGDAEYLSPPMPTQVARAEPGYDGVPIVGGPRANTRSYVPQHLRTAQLSSEPMVGGGSPIVTQNNGSASRSPGAVTSSRPIVTGEPAIVAGNGVTGMVDGCVGCSVNGGGCCGSCDAGGGVGANYFDSCGDPCAGVNGGCPPESWDNCWLWGLGGIFRRGEIFGGAHGFRSQVFNINTNNGTDSIHDCSFGFYGGFNLGIPLCKLTCGLLSGQIGVRSAFSEFDGNSFTTENRDQLFVTGGLYRRVDYGLQAGVVVDYLQETWFADTSVSQIRGDVAWVYPSGSALGFRYATGNEDDVVDGVVNGNTFTGLTVETLENYRFYYRYTEKGGGFADFFAGWTNDDHGVIGFDIDRAIGEFFGMQSGFTYFIPDDSIQGSQNDAWNIYVGFSYRPRGRAYYLDYDRPLLPVADNGSMVLRRSN